MGFGSLQHLKDSRSTTRGLCLPASFRLQGLATLLTAYSLEPRAGFVSHRQRSWDSPFGGFPFRKVSTAFPPGWTHLPLTGQLFRRRLKRRTGPTSVGFQGLAFRKCLATAWAFRPATAGASLGIHPSRASQQRP